MEVLQMKRYRKVFGMTAALAALVCAAWFCIYHNRKSSDNLPDLKSISVMSEAEINEIVCGYKRNQLSYIWKNPDKSGEWYLVKNPTLPPIDFIPAARPASFHPES